MSNQYDVIIIGSGPGGYIAAIRASQLGLKTAIIEREHMGGICLNWGCIPTKALLRSAEIYENMRHSADYGLKSEKIEADITQIVKRSRAVTAQMASGVAYLMKKNKIDVIWGEAAITARGEVTVSESKKPIEQPQNPVPKGVLPQGKYSAKNIIIATGARPRILPGIEPDGDKIWTYFEAMKPKSIPKSILVMGSGAIGIEFASFYRALGVKVTIIELMENILPIEDEEISKLAQKRFEKNSMKIFTKTKLVKVEKQKNSITAHIELANGQKEKITAEKLISAVGVICNTENLGLEKLGVQLEKGAIKINEYCQTNIEGIYAIGDVAGSPMLAHKAEHEAIIAVEKIAGKNPHPLDRRKIPGCTYCHPQIGSVGLTERAAKERGYKIKVGRFPFIGNGKAVALGEPDGLVKTIFDAKTGELLGAHMIGAEVTELIQGFVIAMNLETTEEELMHTIFPHPTLSETMKESVLDAYGKALNM